TKQSNPDQLGKFGSGFLSTHLISKKVLVKGTLRDDDGVRKGFEFELDRAGEDDDEIGTAMQRSLDALIEVLDQKRSKPTDWTEYVYQADGALNIDELETDFPFDAIPYILVFDENVDAIELRLQDKRYSYTRAGSEELEGGGYVTVIEGIDSADRFVVHEEDGIWAAVPVSEREDGGYELRLPGDVPRLFKFLPLVNSVNLGLPAVFHSPVFSTTETRDGLLFAASGPQSAINKGLLGKIAKCFLQLARNCAAEDFDDLHLLLDVSEVSELPAWLED
ncbi:hypothetical protein WDZ92_47240, partial [Nostoc sp. NIES-2111]